MRITKPEWLHHDADKKKLTAIFSVDFHPTGTLLATAGMDNKIRIWNTSAITTDASERLYTTLTAHSGAVLSVRFSPTGRYLASGADDMVVLIWEHDTELRTWQPIRRLVGHESDVCDLAWSSRFLASCGLDNNIFIWDAQTFDIVKRIRGHEQFVKGVTFDPAERFLASQSDDKSLKIWRTSDWQLHRTITKPFEDNIFSTYFCRPSWAPDGDCIALANAANGRVPVAAVVTREWSVDLSLVGHHAAIEAVRFNPRVFSNSSAEDPPLCVCAAGGQDRSVTVWLTNQSVPLVAATELFSGSLLDLAWHTLSVPEKEPDGPSVVARLAACSFDGTVAVLEFTEDELGLPIDMGEQEEMLVKHGWTKASNNNKRGAVDEPGDSKRPRPIAESVVQLRMEAENKAGEAPAGGSVAETAPVGGSAAETTLVGSTVGVQSTIQHTADVKMPVPVRTKSGKKRVAPLFVRPLGVAPSMAAAQPAQLKEREQQEQQEQQGRHGDHEQLDQGSTAVPRVAVNAPLHIDALLLQPRPHSKQQNKNDAYITLGPQSLVHSQLTSLARIHLTVPRLVAQLKSPRVTAHNTQTQSTLTYTGASKWTKRLPPVLLVASSPWVVASSTQGLLHLFDPRGARLLPPLVREAQLAHLVCRGPFCLALDCIGQLDVFNVELMSSVVQTSVAPLLYSETMTKKKSQQQAPPSTALTKVDITAKTGMPLVTLADGRLFVFHGALKTWVKVEDPEEYEGSEHKNNNGKLQLVAQMSDAEKHSVTMDHLEHLVWTADLTNSDTHYVDILARQLARSGDTNRIKFWLDTLLGPPLVPGLCPECPRWQPTLASTPKRQLLQRILPILAANRHLQSIVAEYSSALDQVLATKNNSGL